MEEEKEEWDGPWKEALDSLALVRREVLDDEFRRWYRLIDWIIRSSPARSNLIDFGVQRSSCSTASIASFCP